ncbi:hypothetical protein [Streptosporangium sp. NPDC001681]|uniref:hypothetical protein n=1 Tax=Streptosporangium sp. NPDC001681 TaxID=3154395 RepID=UPI00331C631E
MIARQKVDIDGAAHLVLADGVMLLHPAETVLEAMLTGRFRQQRSRMLSVGTATARLHLVRRFIAFTGTFPWQ